MNWIKNLHQKLLNFCLTLRVSILALFLSLFLTSFMVALIFLYYKTQNAVAELANNRMEFIRRDIVHRTNTLFAEARRFVESTAGLCENPDLINAQNPWLKSYMLHVVANYPNTTYFFIGLEKTGDYLEAGNLKNSVQTHYLSDRAKLLPKTAAYEWQFVEQPREGRLLQEEMIYYDQTLRPVASESSRAPYDPRKRPWYIEAKQAGQFHWSHVYKGFDTGDLGMTATKPLYNANGVLTGVIASELSLRLLSEFFLSQRIAKTGRVVLLDEQGNVLVSSATMLEKAHISPALVDYIMKQTPLHQKKEFTFRYQGVRYLAYVDHFPIVTGDRWQIAIFVPFYEIFGGIEKANLEVILIILAISVGASALVVYFAKKISAPIHALSDDVNQIRLLNLEGDHRIHSRILEIALMDTSIHAMKLAFRSFVRYVPKEIVKQSLAQNKEIELGGEKKELTILFSDIENFTTITEEKPIDLMMPLLAEYFDGISKIILRNQGTIDKYIGDGIMAFWGAPTEVRDHAVACARAALECRDWIQAFNERNRQQGKPLFRTRIGINTGTAIVGNVGTSERMNYTLIGDSVNTAARLQVTNKLYHTQILISEQVAQKIGDQFLMRPLDIVEVKGKKQKVVVYELRALKEPPPSSQEVELCQRFHEAFDAFQPQKFADAKARFETLVRIFPDDFPSQLYLDRLKTIG